MKKEVINNSFRVRKMIDGKSYCMTFDHNPTKKEIEEEINRRRSNVLVGSKMSFKEASDIYIDSKKEVLSVASVREYRRTPNRLPEWFRDMYIENVDKKVLQRLVNEMAKTLSAKTVKDRYAYVVTVIKYFNETFNPGKVALPTIVEKEKYIPTHEEVKKLVDGSVGTQYHIALQLACYGLRREDICALEVEDVFEQEGYYFIHINKGLVQDENKKWRVERQKTAESVRTINIDEDLAKEILELGTGRVYKGYPEAISTYLKRQQTKLGIPQFPLHRFRHYFCTTLAENNYDEATIFAMGGWKPNSDVMKRVYRHSNIGRDLDKLVMATDLLKQART